jgi:glutamate synthase (NADPH/NADH) large chain
MSGGVAYVLDLRDGAVNGQAVSGGALQLTGLTDADQEVVETLLRQQAEETGSPRAAELLADLPAAFARFTRVLPTQYDRMRRALAQAEADGLDVHAPGVWNQILEVSRG